VKTREKLFTELKTELELHASLEEQHLFPILRRNAETKELVTEAIKDNKDLRAKLAELEALPKNDEAFPERLKELQKTFRQHARDEKRELLPAVQRALSEEQIQGVAEKIEAGVAEAEQGREDELEARKLKARQERERAERQSERQAEAEREQQAAAEKTRQEEAEQKRAKARQERQEATHQAEQEAAARQVQEEAECRVHDTAEAVTRAATAAQTSVFRVAKGATTSTQRIGTEVLGVTDTYMEAVKRNGSRPSDGFRPSRGCRQRHDRSPVGLDRVDESDHARRGADISGTRAAGSRAAATVCCRRGAALDGAQRPHPENNQSGSAGWFASLRKSCCRFRRPPKSSVTTILVVGMREPGHRLRPTE
jgi:hypothetical protein